MKRLLVAAVFAVPAVAHADICTERATTLARGKQVATFCKECGDAVPGMPFVATTTIADPAHTYLRTAPDRFENLALLVQCSAIESPPSLAVTDETPNGILIVPSDIPVTTEDPEVRDVPPPRAPPAMAGPTYYSTTIVHSVPWLVIAAAAGGAGFLLGIGATLLVLAARRRRAMEPRASRLTV
jgi:hypothetical protein